MSYSQLGQDFDCLAKYPFSPNQNYFYVDIGASDGISLSNTYLLEKNGWNGICIEPESNSFTKLVSNRNSININCACYKSDEEVDFLVSSEPMLSGIEETIFKNNLEYKSIKVKAKTLTQILDEYQAATHIQYLSLDVEGGELNVLLGCDFNKYSFGIIDVEHNYMDVLRGEIKELLESKGYKFALQNKWDDRYELVVPQIE